MKCDLVKKSREGPVMMEVNGSGEDNNTTQDEDWFRLETYTAGIDIDASMSVYQDLVGGETWKLCRGGAR